MYKYIYMNGLYLIDKPFGISSFDVIRCMRKSLNMRKMWHTGTLDPFATGAMLVATGNYTKLIPYLEKVAKTYEFDVMLDGVTDSWDLAEPVSYISAEQQEHYKHALTQATVHDILQHSFLGDIEQVPPIYSALKVDGKRAYDRARSGEQLEMKSRAVTIHEINIIDYAYPRLTLQARVSAGTYIRSIAVDLGEMVWSGGYVSRLRRTHLDSLDVLSANNIESLMRDAWSDLPQLDLSSMALSEVFPHMTCICLREDVLVDINHGKLVYEAFDYPLHTDLFVVSDAQVTHIVHYNGEFLKPVRKI